MSAADRKQAGDFIETFWKWVNEHVWELAAADHSTTIMIVPQGRPGANYRDVPLPSA